MVKITASVTIAMVASQCSATALYLTTQSAVTNGKQGNIQNQLLVYDQNAHTPCANSDYQAFCGVAPQTTGSKLSGCGANYNGTQSWKDAAGFFYNTNGVFVNDGIVGYDRKDGTNQNYNVTNDSHCKTFNCQIKDSTGSSTITWQGFKCTV